ncbi:sugar transferase [Hoylesella timonensis]|uniref:Sugar transferase n=1 Tax=Hoylesella timonensis TaxID=386414 RepID=A0A2K0XNC9_9BACT|nr:sugar transferase [Hoylesella timonensis]PNP96036.1 sugar transferase [Hoylesella timonensis]
MHLKYIFDKSMSLLGLIFLSPVLLVVSCLIRLKMPGGSVLFKQKRVGQHGRLFTVYKFRSMTVAGEGQTSIAAAEESRITPLGEKLRRYKLDELPELWNVLKGDMSFVGPRPDVPGYADKLKGEDRNILKLKPGITGPASLKYRNEEELLSNVSDPIAYNNEVIYPDKIKLNLYYYYHYSFVKDLQMIFCTVVGKKMWYNGEMI